MEVGVVNDNALFFFRQPLAGQKSGDVWGDIGKNRCTGHFGVVDAVYVHHHLRDRAPGVDERMQFGYPVAVTVCLVETKLDDFIPFGGRQAGGFGVAKDIPLVQIIDVWPYLLCTI